MRDDDKELCALIKRSVLSEGIQNVIAHSHADKIQITLTMQSGSLKILFADNGTGIEKEDLKHIFERLYKCDRGGGLKKAVVLDCLSYNSL